MTKIKRTTVNIDTELVDEARELLGANTMVETIHSALEEIVARQERRKLSAWEFPDSALDELEQARKARLPGDK